MNTKSQFLNEPHFAILKFESIYIEGDERSRTNPGHGYPAHFEDRVSYEAFTDESKWKEEIQRKLKNGDKNFVAMTVNPAKITTHYQIDIQK